MLHEAYAPDDTASVAWSSQKKTAFFRLVSDMRGGMRPPSVVLLYGPTGCGKLSSVRAMLQEQRDAAGLPLRVDVMHSCETTPQQYYSFLMDTFTEQEMTGDESGRSLPLTSLAGAEASNDGKSRAWQAAAAQGQRHSLLIARVVKFYGESPMSPLHARTLRFLDHYDKWRRTSFLDASSAGDGNASFLQRHLVVLILTTHDTHSDKVALGKLLPSRVLTHPCIHSFHCTPLTTRNMSLRIKDVLRMERKIEKIGVKCRISDKEVEFVCEHSHGDICQALLQVQWHCLLADGGPNERAEMSISSARTQGKRRPHSRSKTPKNVMDLLDDNDNAHEITSTLQSSLTVGKNCDEGIEFATLYRDEYLDVAHAAARILTQKYTVSSVIKGLNTEPDKLLSYLTNNMPFYFCSDQIEDYAVCSFAASTADALRATESFGKCRQTDAGVHTVQLTSGDDNAGMGIMRLDVISLLLFGKVYEVCHKDVFIPRTFMAQHPPPYQPMAYPRIRDVGSGKKRTRNDDDSDVMQQKRRQGGYELFSTELEWRQEFLRRLQIRPLTGGRSWCGTDVDIVRETLPALVNRCSSLDAVLLEYAPYARHIVLAQSLSACASRSYDNDGTVELSSKVAPCKKRLMKMPAQPTGPKKTLFSFGAATESFPVQKRPCSLLRYNVLCCGLKEKPAVREEYFTLVKRSDEGGGNSEDDFLDDAAADTNAPLPLLPDGEEIEEYSD